MPTQDDLPGEGIARTGAMLVASALIAVMVGLSCCGGALIGLLFKAT